MGGREPRIADDGEFDRDHRSSGAHRGVLREWIALGFGADEIEPQRRVPDQRGRASRLRCHGIVGHLASPGFRCFAARQTTVMVNRPTVGRQRFREAAMQKFASESQAKTRVLKAPAVRRGELIDCAERLFLSRGYERTTINDVIVATGLSKGAFYHYFRSKEALLEAIAQRFAEQSLAFVDALRAERDEGALASLNRVLAVGREWKLEHMRELRAMFTTLLK